MSDNINQSDNCTSVDDLVKRYYLPAMYGSIFIVGVTGNLMALLVYLLKVRPWKSSTIIMVNLIATDFLFMICLPFLTYQYTLADWTLGDVMCQFTHFNFHFNLYGSILFLSCLAIFRYVAVVHPEHAQLIKQKRWGVLACVLVWVVTVAEISPIFKMFNNVMENNNNKTNCLDFASNKTENIFLYSLVLTALGYVLPLIVVCVCYWRIMRVLNEGPHMNSRKRVRARRLIGLILTCFILCFFPYHVLRALRIYTNQSENNCLLVHGVHAAYIISRPIAAFNIIFNLLLYTLSSDCFKQAFVELFKCEKLMPKTQKTVQVAVIDRPVSKFTPEEGSRDHEPETTMNHDMNNILHPKADVQLSFM